MKPNQLLSSALLSIPALLVGCVGMPSDPPKPTEPFAEVTLLFET